MLRFQHLSTLFHFKFIILFTCQINKAVAEHKKLVETSGRLQRMLPDKDAFVDNLTKARQAAHEVTTTDVDCILSLQGSFSNVVAYQCGHFR